MNEIKNQQQRVCYAFYFAGVIQNKWELLYLLNQCHLQSNYTMSNNIAFITMFAKYGNRCLVENWNSVLFVNQQIM